MNGTKINSYFKLFLELIFVMEIYKTPKLVAYIGELPAASWGTVQKAHVSRVRSTESLVSVKFRFIHSSRFSYELSI